MKKVLIWDKKIALINAGGPAGYLWNLKTYMQTMGIKDAQVFFYSDIIKEKYQNSSFFSGVANVLFRVMKLRLLGVLFYTYFAKGILSSKEKEVISQFDYVHFHTIGDAISYAKLIKSLGVKTILTTHTPEPNIDEIIGGYQGFTKRLLTIAFVRNFIIRTEINAYRNCDYNMFPVEDVLECYTCNSSDYEKYFLENKSKLFYVPTAIKDLTHSPKEKYLDKYNIPKDAKKICYVGRHNKIKGYEYLKEIATKVLADRDDIYFIIGGAPGIIKPLQHSHWIELGWVNTLDLLNEIDIFILANQQTYFDIIVLEILRAGKPLITTLTGGNKYISQKNEGGVIFIPTNDLQTSANIIEQLTKQDVKELGLKNREMFINNFTPQIYLDTYKNELSKL